MLDKVFLIIFIGFEKKMKLIGGGGVKRLFSLPFTGIVNGIAHLQRKEKKRKEKKKEKKRRRKMSITHE